MTILGLDKSFITMNRPYRNVFDYLFPGKYKRWKNESLTQVFNLCY